MVQRARYVPFEVCLLPVRAAESPVIPLIFDRDCELGSDLSNPFWACFLSQLKKAGQAKDSDMRAGIRWWTM
ncbi:hypothetical protein C8R47DRAFT_1114252 [Mycena vitilis]|nr:hypothetical protein C8R47DRAFT_1114252 [Mycena vitilis]